MTKSTLLCRRMLSPLRITVCLLIVIAVLLYVRSNRTPVYTVKSISTFSFDQTAGTVDQIPPAIRRLDGQRLTLDGEMWAGSSAANQLTQFDLVQDKMEHSFDGGPKVQGFIKCGSATPVPYYYSDRVRVTGVLHIDIKTASDGVEQVFRFDVEKLVLAPPTVETLMEKYSPWSWYVLAGLCAVPVLFAAAFVRRRIKRQQRRSAGLCITCGYDLRASTDRCPECGSPFVNPSAIER